MNPWNTLIICLAGLSIFSIMIFAVYCDDILAYYRHKNDAKNQRDIEIAKIKYQLNHRNQD